MTLGTLQQQAYDFVRKYPAEWHSYSKDAVTKRVIKSLENKGLVETNQFHQFRLKDNKMTLPLKHLKPYQRPDNEQSRYTGKTYEGTYTVYGVTRDSDAVDVSNFRAILRILGGESENVFVTRASHWAVGWIDTIRINVNSPDELILKAEDLLAQIADYTILDEMLWSEVQIELGEEDD